jgi:5'-nucleotidase
VALNVNYPVVLDSAGRFNPSLIEEVRVTSVGHAHVVRPTYVRVPNTADTYQALGPICAIQTACAPETQPDADTTALDEGAISLSPLSVDGSERPELRPLLRVRLRR